MKSFKKNYLAYFLTFTGVMFFLLLGCGKDDPAEQPTLGTLNVSDVTKNTAVISGTVVHDGGASITEKGVVWSTSQDPTVDDNEGKTSAGSGEGDFTLTLTGLDPGTLYYVKGYATNSEGTAYSSQLNFTTDGELATVTTTDITDITTESAVSGGEVTDDGGLEVTVRGVVWSGSENPTVTDNEGMTTDGSGTGEFTSDITGLSPQSKYYVRAYATNSEGTAYGEEKSFTTEGELAVVTTANVTNITHESAVSGGEVTDDGGLEVTARGVVWSGSENPTVDDNDGMTTDGSGTGSFTSDITGLSPQSTYYVRAYATNALGTAYGEQKDFQTNDPTVVDIEGNEYNTVTIGQQRWMAENLRTTRLNDKTPIAEITDGDEWAKQTEPAYSWYGNYGEKFKDVYGALYNFYTVAKGNLCPEGWRVPTDDDWKQLIKYLGGEEVAGGKLKSTTAHWNRPNEGATNESGFTALPGGLRIGEAEDEFSDGEFVFLNELGAWWAYLFTWDKGGRAYILSHAAELIGKTDAPLNIGMSVRCIKGEQGELPVEGAPPGYVMP